MVVIPGGGIIGGMGGRIYVNVMGTDPSQFVRPGREQGPRARNYLDVEQWAIARQWINAECPHTGTWGAITRRNVAYDWQFQCSLPLDQTNTLPDRLLGVLPADIVRNPFYVNCPLPSIWVTWTSTRKPGDGNNPAFYFAPACMIRSCQPVLNAARDVIRYQVTGEGNSRLYLYPDEEPIATITYLSPGPRQYDVIMPQKITLTIEGQPRELEADYLNPAALEYWQAWLAHEARLAHNPLVEFAAKVQALAGASPGHRHARIRGGRELRRGAEDRAAEDPPVAAGRADPVHPGHRERRHHGGKLRRGLPDSLSLHPAAGICGGFH